MNRLLVLLLASLLQGCIPYPTIDRQPEPSYGVLGRNTLSALYVSYQDANSPFYNPRLAQDIWYEIVEWAQSHPRPLIRKQEPAEETYWRQRTLQFGYNSEALNYLMDRSKASSTYDQCQWVTRAGRASILENFAKWPRCSTLDAVDKYKLIVHGVEWRKKWGSPSATVFSCALEVRQETMTRGKQPDNLARLQHCKGLTTTQWQQAVAFAEKMAPRWSALPQ